jgi:adenine-specific DNA-methyltransferase
LESHEDALNNIAFTGGRQEVMQFDDYLLHYMLKFETRESETFLNVDKLSAPFDYKLKITEGQETVEKSVDLPETFNYLLGLKVKTRRVVHDGKTRYLVYRGTAENKQVAVLWRTTTGWKQVELERDKNFVLAQKLTEGADEIFVNGDSFIPKAQALEPLFKRRMFGEPV